MDTFSDSPHSRQGKAKIIILAVLYRRM